MTLPHRTNAAIWDVGGGGVKGAAGISRRQPSVFGVQTHKFDAQWYRKLPHVFSIFY